MESSSQKGLWLTDLILVIVLTLLTLVFVIFPPFKETFIRYILGMLLVLFIPGYSLVSAFFPSKGDLNGIERAALSFGLSIAITALIGLALNYTPWGIRLDPILISITYFTIFMIVVAFLRRSRLPAEERFTVPFKFFRTQSIFPGKIKKRYYSTYNSNFIPGAGHQHHSLHHSKA